MAQDLGPGKSACIVAVVVGCFAILWPSIFYPMLKGSIFPSKDDRNEYNRQEQSHYIRPNALHPAMREHGRAMPQPHSVPQPSRERRSLPPPVIAAKKPPIPGLRPPMAGGGHVSSQKDNGPMGILMPLYTVGIVIFFVYTITKLVCKKHNNTQYINDPEFHRLVHQNKAKESKQSTDVKRSGNISQDAIKLGWQENDIIVSAISSLLQEVNHDILKREMKKEQQEIHPTEDSIPDKNSSEKLVRNEFNAESNEKCVAEKANTEKDCNSQEINDPIQVRGTETSVRCTNEQSSKHLSEESASKSSTLETNQEEINPSDIALLTNEPRNSDILITDAKDSNQEEVDKNEIKEKTMHVPVEDSENSESNESKTREQDCLEKDVSTTEL